MKYTNEQLEFIVKTVETTEGSWEQKYETTIQAFRDEYNEILNYTSWDSLRSLYKRARKYLGELKEIEQDIETEGKSFNRLNEMFRDGMPETKTVKGEKYCIFKITQHEELTGESYAEPVAIKLSIIDDIFKDYVAHGNNMTGQEVCDKYGLTGKAWNVLKTQMNLNKQSNIVSEPTLEDMGDDEVENLADFHISNKNKQRIKKAHDKKVKEALEIMSSNKNFLEWVQSYIQDYKPLPVNFKPEKIKNNNSATFFLSDVHIGRGETDSIIRRLATIQQDIILSPERIIYIENLGDLAESLVPVGGMHPGQHEEMDYRYGFGFDLMMNIVKIMEKFLMEIYKAGKEVHFQGITGNHGRVADNKQHDPERTGELVIYELLKRGLSQTKMDISYLRETVNTFSRGNIRYIIGHGDGRPFDNQKPADIILKHGDTTKFNLIVSGDKHNFKMMDIHDKGFWIKTRALASRGRYESQQDYRNLPGYIKVVEDTKGKANITIHNV